MNDMKRVVINLVFLFLVLGGAYALYTYFKPVEDITTKKVDLSNSSSDLMDAFSADADAAHNRFNGKVLSVSGTVSTVELLEEAQTNIIFDDGGDYLISFQLATFDRTPYPFQTPLTIKGQYNGFLPPDDLFDMPGIIQLTQCTVEPQ
jgi:hypothetical protein